MDSLPSPREYVDSLVAQLALTPRTEIKPLILTLHCLFPNELLFALDLLDRKLVKRLVVQGQPRQECAAATAVTDNGDDDEVFFVLCPPGRRQSAVAATAAAAPAQEVRLRAWNCTCASFTLAAFANPLQHHGADLHTSGDASALPGYPFGGSIITPPRPPTTTTTPPPVCKHLLACILAARCPALFGSADGSDFRQAVSAAELAGWCAGWAG